MNKLPKPIFSKSGKPLSFPTPLSNRYLFDSLNSSEEKCPKDFSALKKICTKFLWQTPLKRFNNQYSRKSCKEAGIQANLRRMFGLWKKHCDDKSFFFFFFFFFFKSFLYLAASERKKNASQSQKNKAKNNLDSQALKRKSNVKLDHPIKSAAEEARRENITKNTATVNLLRCQDEVRNDGPVNIYFIYRY